MVIIQKNMNAPTSPDEIIGVWCKWKHGKNHADHWQELGIPFTIVDPASDEKDSKEKIIHFRGTIQDYLAHATKTPQRVLISSPDNQHIADLRSCVEKGVRFILVEKPVAMNLSEFNRFKELHTEAWKNGQIITSCLPRIPDVRYRQFADMMVWFREELGDVRTISHRFSANKEGNKWSAGRDHLAHEIATLLDVLWFNGQLGAIKIYTFHDSADAYECYGFINDQVYFSVWGNKKWKETEETIVVGFEKGEARFNTRTKEIIVSPKKWAERKITMVDGDAKGRLMTISQNFVEARVGVKGTKLYLPENLLNASVQFPATLFPDQEAAS